MFILIMIIRSLVCCSILHITYYILILILIVIVIVILIVETIKEDAAFVMI